LISASQRAGRSTPSSSLHQASSTSRIIRLDIKREAAWAVSNATSGGDLNQQIRQLVNYSAIPPSALSTCMDLRIVMVALEEGLNNILRAGSS
jgi:hypothetical protein